MKGKQEMPKTNTTFSKTNTTPATDKAVITVNVKSQDGRIEMVLHLTRKEAQELMEELHHRLTMMELTDMIALFEEAE